MKRMLIFGLIASLGIGMQSCDDTTADGQDSEENSSQIPTLSLPQDRPEVRTGISAIDHFHLYINIDNGKCDGIEEESGTEGDDTVTYQTNPDCVYRRFAWSIDLNAKQASWSEIEQIAGSNLPDSMQPVEEPESYMDILTELLSGSSLCHREVPSDAACPSIYMLPYLVLNPDSTDSIEVGALHCDHPSYLCDGIDDELKELISSWSKNLEDTLDLSQD